MPPSPTYNAEAVNKAIKASRQKISRKEAKLIHALLRNEHSIDWHLDCAYTPEQKRRFHVAARARLRKLAEALDFAPESYDLRSNEAGPAVSGEITLHHEHVYVQVSQSAMGHDRSVLIRTCQGRRDYTGGRNHFAPLSMLDDIPALAARVRAVIEAGGACCGSGL